MLTRSQIQASTDVGTLPDTVADFLRFVTEFFEIISRSVPHICQSALLFAPRSSVVRELYGAYIELKHFTDIPASWDSFPASAGPTIEVNRAVWSPRDRLIAVGWADRVELRDSNTLKSVSILKPPSSPRGAMITPQSLTFSPDGRTLACIYHR